MLFPCGTERKDQLWSFTGSGGTSCVRNDGTGMHLSVSGLVDPYLGQFVELWQTPSDCGPAEDWQAHFAVRG